MERKRDKQMEKLFEGNASHWICRGEVSGRRSGPVVSLCGPTQALPWAFWSSFLSGRKAPLLRPSSPPSSSGVRASSFQSAARFRCPGAAGCPPSLSPSGPPRPAGTSTSVVERGTEWGGRKTVVSWEERKGLCAGPPSPLVLPPWGEPLFSLPRSFQGSGTQAE